MIVKPCRHATRRNPCCDKCWKLRAKWNKAKANRKIAKTLRG